MRALVTGNAGFAGRHLTRLLEADGVEVVGFNLGDGRDVRDFECLRECLDTCEPDYVFHLAAQPAPAESWRNPVRGHDVIAGGALHLLEAIRHTDCDARVLLVGSEAEYGEALRVGRATEEWSCWPVSPYATAKLAATHYALNYTDRYNLPVVVVRPSYHTGPGQPARQATSAFARRIAQVEAGHATHLVHGALTASRAILDVRDVVRGYRLAINLQPGIYNLSADATPAMGDILDLLIGLAATEIPTKPTPGLGVLADQTPWFSPDHGKITAACGWTPQIPLTQTLTDLLDFWRRRL